MSVERFPMRHAVCVWVLREADGWLVLAREHGWIHGDYDAALADAEMAGAQFRIADQVQESCIMRPNAAAFDPWVRTGTRCAARGESHAAALICAARLIGRRLSTLRRRRSLQHQC